MDGSVGLQARLVQTFGEGLARASGLPIEYWDERLSSVQAERAGAGTGRRAGRRPRRRREPADDVAAAIILQGYLDRQRARTERDGP
jgi:putative Holliday junction resolvase